MGRKCLSHHTICSIGSPSVLPNILQKITEKIPLCMCLQHNSTSPSIIHTRQGSGVTAEIAQLWWNTFSSISSFDFPVTALTSGFYAHTQDFTYLSLFLLCLSSVMSMQLCNLCASPSNHFRLMRCRLNTWYYLWIYIVAQLLFSTDMA